MHKPMHRIDAIDALRGFCLLGIIFAHYIYWHSGGPLPEEVYQKHYGWGSTVAVWFNNLFVFGKFFALFSFLFGLSFYLQLKSGINSGQPFVARYVRRLLVLFFIAIIHQTFWMGDILIIYVPLGFVLLLMRHASDKAVATFGVLFILNVPGKLWEVINFFFLHTEQPDLLGQLSAPYQQVIQHGSLVELWAFNWKAFPAKMHMQVFSGRLIQTLGFFMLGMYVGRQHWFEKLDDHKALVVSYLKKASWWSLGLLVIALSVIAANELAKLGWQNSPVANFVFTILFDSFSFALVIVYIAGISRLLIQSKLRSPLLALAPVGKMALTSYLTQTLIGLSLFFGFGCHWYLKTSPGVNFGIAALVFLLQTCLAKWWFSQYRFGPVEWLWRCATDGRLHPLRLK